MRFTWFDVIVLFGVIQGIATAFLLLKNKNAANHTKLLAAILLVFSLLSFKIALHTLGLWDKPGFRYFPLAIDLLIQPLLYLYAACFVIPGFRFDKRKLLHFLPALFFLIHAIIVYVDALPQTDLHLKDVIAEQWHFNAIKAVEDDLSVFSAVIYWVLSFWLVRQYRNWLFQNTSNTAYPTFSWLRNMLAGAGILGFVLLINVVLDQVFHFSANHFLHWQLFYVYLSMLIYYTAFNSYQQKTLVIIGQSPGLIPNTNPAPSKYSSIELEAAKIKVLKALEEDRLFLNSELSLNALAAHINLSPALVSEVFNKEFGKTFRNFVNDLRVAEVKLKLVDKAYKHLSILGIAYECGFNSEASFYRIFKTTTGMSPKAYIDKATN